MLKVNLSHIAAQKGITKVFAHLRKNGFTHYKAHALASGTVKYLDLKDLERLCILFRCMPEDILEYVPTLGRGAKTRGNMPIHKLMKNAVPVSVIELLKQMNKDEVEKWVEDLKNRGSGSELG